MRGQRGPLVTLVVATQLVKAASAWAAAPDLVGEVDPFIGTDDSHSPHPVPGGAGGSTFPGATAPFGMIQWSPDTPTGSPSGFRYQDRFIEGFSLTHFDGAGCPNNEDLPILPTLGPLATSPGSDWNAYLAPYAHASEVASPGYYAVTLAQADIRVELTATTRTGLGRFRFPASPQATLLFDVSHHATGAKPGAVEIIGRDELSGQLLGGDFCRAQATFPIFYVVRFDRPFAGFGTWNGKTLAPGARTSQGKSAGAYVVFDTRAERVVQLKVGLSYVSVENARRNLETESPRWDFAETRAATAAAWNGLFGRVRVDGGSADERRAFYTALYHVFQNPSVASDVNGQYRGYDDAVHTAAHVTYQNYSGWDIYRSWIQLMAMLAPRETNDILKSMVEAGQQLGHLPKWTHQNRETNVMNGDPGTLIVANGYAFGARAFDTQAALALMNASGSERFHRTVRGGLASYLRTGYLGDAATTLENTSADFALSRFAQALGDVALANTYAARAGHWRNLFNPASGYLQPRQPDGTWQTPFDPASGRGFVEGNAAQYTWMVPYDLRGLFDELGGNQAAIARLDALFRELNAGTERPHFYIGNEPQFATPWAYHFAGAPWKTAEVVRRIVAQSFHVGPGGLPGNDDLGATSSWYVWAALGLYPAVPGTDVLALHGPLFPVVTIDLGDGKRLALRGAGADTPYVRGLRVNGRARPRAWLRYAEIAAGATLDFTMGRAPDRAWGSDRADAPPSFSAGGHDAARGKRATSSTPCAPTYGPEKAVDGSLREQTDKWCSQAPDKWLQVDLGATVPVAGFVVKHVGLRGGSASAKWCSHGAKWLEIDLGAATTLSKLVLAHAGAGGEARAWNTRDFKLSVSADRRAWNTVVEVTGNTRSFTSHAIAPTPARYLRLDVVTPTSTKDTAARIYELQAYDQAGVNVAHGKPATADGSCNADEGPEKAVDGGDEAGGNTRDFDLALSVDGRAWKKVVRVVGNTASQTSHPIAPTPARYVRLNVITPSSDGSPAARIYDLEVATAGPAGRAAQQSLPSSRRAAARDRMPLR